MPAKFNRVLREEVDADIAIQCLNNMVELYMSETEGDDFLALSDGSYSRWLLPQKIMSF